MSLVFGLVMYTILYRRRYLFTDRYGMIVSIVCSSIICLTISMHTLFLLPFSLMILTISNVVLGAGVGVLFGSLVNSQSILSGVSHGVIGSLMGTMLGAVIQNPTLCSLPAAYLNTVQQNMIILSFCTSILVAVTMLVVYFSLRV
ncbi:hypothetical protein [Bacillus suaedaesalsae]|uniref:Ammonium transporter AmtB-like domain-containing protein n=1 Tax=Bacillus suaedaesalsae TaxID=2810349 RepID=A0ABS2DI83_9BACI|nr:hypothetical protein [Bacillus suaedaesalsae]MBM6618202.1 hypothetical protein [Bacillus suaedaesalsae]